MKILICLLGLFVFIGNTWASGNKNFEKRYWEIVRKHNSKHGGNAVYRSDTYDKKFEQRMRGLCRDMLFQSKTLGVSLQLQVASCDFCLRDVKINKEICENSYLEDLVAINMGIIKYALWETEDIDIQQSRQWPVFAVDSAFKFVCAPDVMKDEQEKFTAYFMDWFGPPKTTSDGLTGYTVDRDTGRIYTRTFIPWNFSGACHDFYMYLIDSSRSMSLVDIAKKCMNTINDTLSCREYVLRLVEFSQKSIDNISIGKINDIVGSDDKLYTQDKKFYVKYEYARIHGFLEEKFLKLFTAAGKEIGVCPSWDRCKVHDDNYTRYSFMISNPTFLDENLADYSKLKKGLILGSYDFGERGDFVINDMLMNLKQRLSELKVCIDKQGWGAIDSMDLNGNYWSLGLDQCGNNLEADTAEVVVCKFKVLSEMSDVDESGFLADMYGKKLFDDKKDALRSMAIQISAGLFQAKKTLSLCENYDLD